jgi:hypothetical protein
MTTNLTKMYIDSTFAFFKIKRNGSYKYYFISLTHNINYFQSRLEKDSGDNIKVPNVRSPTIYENTTFGSNMTALTSLPSFVKDVCKGISTETFNMFFMQMTNSMQ